MESVEQIPHELMGVLLLITSADGEEHNCSDYYERQLGSDREKTVEHLKLGTTFQMTANREAGDNAVLLCRRSTRVLRSSSTISLEPNHQTRHVRNRT